jgi:hypothetical protein
MLRSHRALGLMGRLDQAYGLQPAIWKLEFLKP